MTPAPAATAALARVVAYQGFESLHPFSVNAVVLYWLQSMLMQSVWYQAVGHIL